MGRIIVRCGRFPWEGEGEPFVPCADDLDGQKNEGGPSNEDGRGVAEKADDLVQGIGGLLNQWLGYVREKGSP